VDLNSVISSASQKSQFKIEKLDLVLSGLCKNCQ